MYVQQLSVSSRSWSSKLLNPRVVLGTTIPNLQLVVEVSVVFCGLCDLKLDLNYAVRK